MHIRNLASLLLLGALACGGESPTAAAPKPAPFRLSLFEPSATIAQNGTAEYAINIFRDAGFTTPLQIEIRSLPRGSASTISPGILEATDAFFVVRVYGSISPGTYQLEIAVKATGVPTVTLPLSLTVR